jgi:hypothetical protein
MPYTWEIRDRIENRIIENDKEWSKLNEQVTAIVKKGGDIARGKVILEEMETICSRMEVDMARLRVLMDEAPEVA